MPTNGKTPQNPVLTLSPDPLVEQAELSEDRKAYLRALAEVGMKDRACRLARQRTGLSHLHRLTINRWRQEDALFAAIEAQVHGEYWDEIADYWQRELKGGERKITGGEANLIMQQFNRSKPEEYLQQLVAQIHQTFTFQVSGGFRDEGAPIPAVAKGETPPALPPGDE